MLECRAATIAAPYCTHSVDGKIFLKAEPPLTEQGEQSLPLISQPSPLEKNGGGVRTCAF